MDPAPKARYSLADTGQVCDYQKVGHIYFWYNKRMNKYAINKQVLQIGTGIIWAAVLIGVSLLTEAEGSRALDWPQLWVIVGGYLVHSILLSAFIKNNEDREDKQDKQEKPSA